MQEIFIFCAFFLHGVRLWRLPSGASPPTLPSGLASQGREEGANEKAAPDKSEAALYLSRLISNLRRLTCSRRSTCS